MEEADDLEKVQAAESTVKGKADTVDVEVVW